MKRLCAFALMHAIFLLYRLYAVLAKFASNQSFLSQSYCALYALLVLILGVYALLWQQVLKRIALSTAIANKCITIVWGMIWGAIVFGEGVSARKLIGAVFIFLGIVVMSFSENAYGKKP